MKASLVYDGQTLNIPESMGTPTEQQLKGTPAEQLGEICSRICYDSLGYDPETGKPRGRSSSKLHDHILELKNHSVYEHFNFTIIIDFEDYYHLLQGIRNFINRKGVWLEIADDNHLEVTLNMRSVLEWDRYSNENNQTECSKKWIKEIINYYGNWLAPQIIRGYPDFPEGGHGLKYESLTADQAWISLYLYGSRGFSHEQVRHRFAISQRSTRYVNESQSDYIEHPLISKYLSDESVDREMSDLLVTLIGDCIYTDRKTYRQCVLQLERYLLDRGQDKQTARKQARGAARGYLGNALATELIFSASINNWKWILEQRANKAADAEIRMIYNQVLPALQASQYGHFFQDYILVDSPDGIGKVLQ